MSLVAKRRHRREFYMPEPERKRICKSLETSPQDIIVCCLPRKCPVDYWEMEKDLKQKRPTDLFSPQITKEKPNSMDFAYVLVNQIFPDNETVTTAQPCPRCIAGEPPIIDLLQKFHLCVQCCGHLVDHMNLPPNCHLYKLFRTRQWGILPVLMVVIY